MRHSVSVPRLFLGLLVLMVVPACSHADTIIPLPSPSYIAETSLLSFAAPDEALISSITNGSETVSFVSVTSLMRASTVGDDWSTWGSPPNTESSTPRVLWSGQDDNFNPVTTLSFVLSAPVSIFGFEAEPGLLDTHTMLATFYMGATVEQTISLDVSGNGGARLFAAQADPGTFFDSVTLTSDIDWAAGEFRYAPAQVPEPGTFAMAIAMAILLTITRKLRGTR